MSIADIDEQLSRGLGGSWSAGEELRVLHTITHAVDEAADMHSALRLVLHTVCQATGWAIGQVWLPGADGAVLVCSPAWHSHATGLERFRTASQESVFPKGLGLPGMTWRTGQPVWSSDVTQEENFTRRSIAAEVGLKAGMAVPMLAGQDVVGVLEFFVFEQRIEDEPIVAFVSTISAHLGAMVRRKQLEEQLRRSEARHRIIVDTALDGIITMSADSVICSFNHGAEHIFGYSAAEIVGQPLTRLMPERFRPHHTTGLQRYLQSGEARILGRVVEVAGVRKDGSEIPLELAVTRVPEDGASLFAGILRDITERKRLEAEREALLAVEQEHSRRLRELAALKSDFSAMVAHELSGPVGTIGGFTHLLSRGVLSPAQEAEALAAIQAEVTVLSRLVSDVRSAASFERDDFHVHLRPVSLPALLTEAATFAKTLSGDHPIHLTDVPTVPVQADSVRITQVVRNLLSNAAKYSRPGTPIELRALRENGHIRIEVADQGHGIPADDLERIFEKFGRGRDQSGGKVPGVGLGLYLSRRIVQAHGGDLRVTSTPGQGSVFSFSLEVAP